MLKSKICMILFICATTSAKNGITFHVTGRLGDNIMTYCQHVLLAQKYNLDLYVPHFRYKEFFALASFEKNLTDIPRYFRKARLRKEFEIKTTILNYLFVSSYYMHLTGIKSNDELGDLLFKRSIEDPAYGSHIRTALALPAIKATIELPRARISVAVHIRKGCGDDYPLFSKQYETDSHNKPENLMYSDKYHNIKFPPEQFYAEQLEKLYHYLNAAPLHVYIFSDAKTPEDIVQRMQAYLADRCDIIFSVQQSNTINAQSILSDIVNMSICDYLIRSESHFPWIAQMIGNHKGIIRPVAWAWAWEDTYLKMTRILIDIPNREMNQLITQDF